MQRVEKTVFMSYRRTNAAWALAVFQNLTSHGYDVFYDYEGVASGDFEQVILGNIKARAHFLILLTPSALKRCEEPGDWLRREIETAMDTQRNIVPLMLDRFDFDAPTVVKRLTGKLARLKRYNALEVPTAYFLAAMERLRQQHLNVPLATVLHPPSDAARKATEQQQAAAHKAPEVREAELTAQQWFERGYQASDPDEKLRAYSEAIRLDVKYAFAYNNRGSARLSKGDIDGALSDYDNAIRLDPKYASAYYNRGNARLGKGGLEGTLSDSSESSLKGALSDYGEAIRLDPKYVSAYYNRAGIWEQMEKYGNASADLQKYLELGGGVRDGDESQVAERIKRLSKK